MACGFPKRNVGKLNYAHGQEAADAVEVDIKRIAR